MRERLGCVGVGGRGWAAWAGPRALGAGCPLGGQFRRGRLEEPPSEEPPGKNEHLSDEGTGGPAGSAYLIGSVDRICRLEPQILTVEWNCRLIWLISVVYLNSERESTDWTSDFKLLLEPQLKTITWNFETLDRAWVVTEKLLLREKY